MSSASDTRPSAGGPLETPRLDDLSTLMRYSIGVIEGLMLPDGIYCFDRDWSDPTLRGRSLRYTLMVALGFQRASAAGYTVGVDAAVLAERVRAEYDALTPGDKGLLLWLLSRLGSEHAATVAADLATVDPATLTPLEGMEIGWLVSGGAAALEHGHDDGKVLARMLAVLRSRRAERSPLYHHLGTGRGRALLPNFATQIYSVLSLADAGRVSNDDRAVADAKALADLLVELRGDDAGWPWLFHAERGRVVETYQVYSVHQDAMAPMAMFALTAACGDERYARSGAEGLPWCFGKNELAFQFYDAPSRFAHRAIKRAGWADRAELWGNTALGLTPLTARLRLGHPQINATCRPYHLGWVLEAWSGREELGKLAGSI